MGRAIGLWWLNACRIVYVVDESGPISRFGLAYGTLPGHVERGEERFMIEWNRGDNSVWYDILAFSRPNHAQGCSIWYLNESRLRTPRDSSMMKLMAALKNAARTVIRQRQACNFPASGNQLPSTSVSRICGVTLSIHFDYRLRLDQ